MWGYLLPTCQCAEPSASGVEGGSQAALISLLPQASGPPPTVTLHHFPNWGLSIPWLDPALEHLRVPGWLSPKCLQTKLGLMAKCIGDAGSKRCLVSQLK